MQTFLLGVAFLLLLCLGSVIVCADGWKTTRETILKADERAQIGTNLLSTSAQYVRSYHFPTLVEVQDSLCVVSEARYDNESPHRSGQVVAKCSEDRGNSWRMFLGVPSGTQGIYARSAYPTVVQQKNNLLIFAETFKQELVNQNHYKSGNGEFLCFLYKVTNTLGAQRKATFEIQEPTSLLTQLNSEMNRLQIDRLIGAFGRGIEVNQTAIVPVWFLNNTNEAYSTVLLSGSPNWRLAKGTGDEGTLESAVVEWEGKLIMNARTDDGYRKVYESTDMGGTWKEALGSLSRVWGNSPYRHGIGCSASFITVTIKNTPVMLFSHPLNTKKGAKRDRLHLWLTDNKRIYDVGQISESDENTGHSSLLYTKGNLYCVYEEDKSGTQINYNSVLAHLVDELEKIKTVVKEWEEIDKAFLEPCDEKDPNPSYPGSICEVHIPQKGLVGFLSYKVTHDRWKDVYGCVDAEIKNGKKIGNGIKFNGIAAGAMWPVGKQEQNQRYHFMNHVFTLAATVVIHECKSQFPMPLMSVVLDTKDEKKLVELLCSNTEILSFTYTKRKKNPKILFTPDRPIRVVFTFGESKINLYIDGQLMLASKISEFQLRYFSTPISHICILQCYNRNSKPNAQATVKNVLLYNRVLEAEEIRILYLSIVPTKRATISKTLSTTETASRSLSHTPSQSTSRIYDGMDDMNGAITMYFSKPKRETQSLDTTNSTTEKGCLKTDCSEKGVELTKDRNKYFDSQPGPLKSTQIPMHTSDGICPLIVVETFPSDKLTQKDIDGSQNGKQILMISLPKQLYWPKNDSVGSLISFSGGTGADQPNGFSGKWGEMLHKVTWRRNTTNPRSVLKAEIPTYNNFNIDFDEEILIRVDPSALSIDCQGTLNGSFIIRAENTSKIVKGSTVVNSVIAGMTAVTIFGAGGVGSILEIQALSLLSRMSCASKDERYGLNFLHYFTSIFVNFGSLWIVFGNALIVIIFGSIHYCVTVLYKRMKGSNLSAACARMFFPSFTYFVAYIMHVGIFVHSVSLLFILKSELHRYIVCFIGTSYGFIFPFYVMYYVACYTDVHVVPYKYNINQSCLKRWLFPLGYWDPRNQVKMYGSIFYTMNNKHLYWCVFHLFVICIAGIVTVIPTPTDRCHIQYFCLMGIFLLGSIATAVTNMMRSVFLTSMHTLSFFLLATLSCIGGLNYVLPNKSLLDTYFLLTAILLIVVFIISVYNAIIVIYDWFYVKNDTIK